VPRGLWLRLSLYYGQAVPDSIGLLLVTLRLGAGAHLLEGVIRVAIPGFLSRRALYRVYDALSKFNVIDIKN
jgi:hypothetical protein